MIRDVLNIFLILLNLSYVFNDMVLLKCSKSQFLNHSFYKYFIITYICYPLLIDLYFIAPMFLLWFLFSSCMIIMPILNIIGIIKCTIMFNKYSFNFEFKDIYFIFIFFIINTLLLFYYNMYFSKHIDYYFNDISTFLVYSNILILLPIYNIVIIFIVLKRK